MEQIGKKKSRDKTEERLFPSNFYKLSFKNIITIILNFQDEI